MHPFWIPNFASPIDSKHGFFNQKTGYQDFERIRHQKPPIAWKDLACFQNAIELYACCVFQDRAKVSPVGNKCIIADALSDSSRAPAAFGVSISSEAVR